VRAATGDGLGADDAGNGRGAMLLKLKTIVIALGGVWPSWHQFFKLSFELNDIVGAWALEY
jgi:hypothetical protein